MEVYVGTSGWLYDWNEGASLDWYLRYSGLNAVELNASFYRFPFPSQVASWRRKVEATGFRWAVKVHRLITHYRKLDERSLDLWSKFRRLFEPLDEYIDFYLLQLPPTFRASEGSLRRLKSFAEAAGLGERLAVEFRDPGWFGSETVEACREVGATVVSVDSPAGTWVVSSSGTVYLRLHGRSAWYAYDYSRGELEDLAKTVVGLDPRRVYVFFNNDHWMLGNARTMLAILRSLSGPKQKARELEP